MLYLIGMGLKAKHITLEGLELIRKVDTIFYEEYTSVVDWIPDLQGIVGKPFRKLGRSDMEERVGTIIDLAFYKDVAVLVPGDPLAATTHYLIIAEARKRGVRVGVVHAPSIMTAVAESGLQLYKFGRVVTVPKEGKLDSVKKFIEGNRSIGLHSLVLLDIGMAGVDGLRRLLEVGALHENDTVLIGSRLGAGGSFSCGTVNELLKKHVPLVPECVILPGQLHFTEREALKAFS